MRPHMLPEASNYRTRASCATSSAHVLHVPDIEPSRASTRYTHLRPSTFVHVRVCIINLRQYLALAVEFPLTLTFDHWLLIVGHHCWPLTFALTFWPSQNFSTWLVLLSFSYRFRFWAPFLHLRSLNPTFLSFSSLWLNIVNEIISPCT